MLDYYCVKTKYQDFKSVYGEFRESLKVLLSIKQSIRITQNLYDGKNLAEELEALNTAFQEFYIEEIDIRRLAKSLIWKLKARLFAKCYLTMKQKIIVNKSGMPKCSGSMLIFYRHLNTMLGFVELARIGSPIRKSSKN